MSNCGKRLFLASAKPTEISKTHFKVLCSVPFAFECKRDWRWPCFDTDLSVNLIYTTKISRSVSKQGHLQPHCHSRSQVTERITVKWSVPCVRIQSFLNGPEICISQKKKKLSHFAVEKTLPLPFPQKREKKRTRTKRVHEGFLCCHCKSSLQRDMSTTEANFTSEIPVVKRYLYMYQYMYVANQRQKKRKLLKHFLFSSINLIQKHIVLVKITLSKN